MHHLLRALAGAFLLLASADQAGTQPDAGQLHRPLTVNAQGMVKVDPTYYEISAATGGDFYFWAPEEFANSKLQIMLPGEAVALSYGSLAAQPRRIAIPVESGVTRLAVFAGAQRLDVAVLVAPDGKTIRGNEAGTRLQTFSHMRLVEVQAPAPGLWQLELRGAGLYSMSAQIAPARDDQAPDAGRLEYVELGGRPGHQGLFPINRDPRKGESLECTVRISGRVSGVEIAFVTAQGERIATVAMAPQEEGGDYYGRCLVPTKPYRVRVSGLDGTAKRFQRIESGLRTPL